MGEEAVNTTLNAYVWVTLPVNGQKYVLICYADSPSDAVDKILLRFARLNSDTDQLIKMEAVLRQTLPFQMDFLDGVGTLVITESQ